MESMLGRCYSISTLLNLLHYSTLHTLRPQKVSPQTRTRRNWDTHLDVSVDFLLCVQIVQALLNDTEAEAGFNLDTEKMTEGKTGNVSPGLPGASLC